MLIVYHVEYRLDHDSQRVVPYPRQIVQIASLSSLFLQVVFYLWNITYSGYRIADGIGVDIGICKVGKTVFI